MPDATLLKCYAALCALLMGAALAPDGAYAQASGSPEKAETGKEALRTAFVEGNAKAVLAQASARVELGLPAGNSQYSRSQAVYVLEKFFENHPPRRFAWQRTADGEQSRFLTGRYWHEGAHEPLAVHLRLAKAQGEWRLQEVRIGPE